MKIPVLLPNIFDHPFTYESDKKVEVGRYVLVPFGKKDAVGWEPYEECRKGGAIIATGHDHLYSRTGNIIEFISSETQIADPESPELNKLKISKGSTFIFTSGLGGSPIINHNNDWPVNYSAKQNANYGGLFCTFNAGGQPNKAFCYFKDIDHKIIQSSIEKKISISELTTKVTSNYHDDCKYLKCEKPNDEPKATENISLMINILL